MASVTVSHVPIVGQPVIVEGYTIAAAARCQCVTGGSLVPLTVIVSAAGTTAPASACPTCGAGYQVQGLQVDDAGRLRFAMAIVAQRSGPAAA